MIPEIPLSDEVALHYTDMYKERVKPIDLSPVAGSEAGSDSGGGGGGSGGDEGGEAGGEEGGSGGGSDGEGDQGDASGGSGGRRAEGGGSPSGSPTASPGASPGASPMSSPRARRAAAAGRSGRKVKESKYERRRRRLVLREARLSNVIERYAEGLPTCFLLASHSLPTCVLLLACSYTLAPLPRYTEETAPLEELRGSHGSPPRGVSMERQISMPRIDSGMDLSLQDLSLLLTRTRSLTLTLVLLTLSPKPSPGNEPMAHVGHSAVHAGTSMAVFGGYGHRQYWNELVLLDTGTMTWMRPHTSGHAPHPCVLHSAVVVRDLMVVYGGALDEKPLDQLVALDLVELRWSRLGYAWGGLRPLPRFGHAAAAIGSRIFVFGGTSGESPVPWYHFFGQALRGTELVHGYTDCSNNELLLIDIERRVFSMPRYAGERPDRVYRHTLTQSRGKLFVFGGVGSSVSPSMKLLDTGLNVDAEEEVPGGGDAGGGDGVASQRKASHPNAKEEVRGFDAGAAAAVVALLQEIGLNKYARIFLKQEVDLESLLQFGDQDLKDIGVVAIGARRKLTTHHCSLRSLAHSAHSTHSTHSTY